MTDIEFYQYMIAKYENTPYGRRKLPGWQELLKIAQEKGENNAKTNETTN